MAANVANTKTATPTGGASPPFWELEALIESGLTCEQALAVLIERNHRQNAASVDALHRTAWLAQPGVSRATIYWQNRVAGERRA